MDKWLNWGVCKSPVNFLVGDFFKIRKFFNSLAWHNGHWLLWRLMSKRQKQVCFGTFWFLMMSFKGQEKHNTALVWYSRLSSPLFKETEQQESWLRILMLVLCLKNRQKPGDTAILFSLFYVLSVYIWKILNLIENYSSWFPFWCTQTRVTLGGCVCILVRLIDNLCFSPLDTNQHDSAAGLENKGMERFII